MYFPGDPLFRPGPDLQLGARPERRASGWSRRFDLDRDGARVGARPTDFDIVLRGPRGDARWSTDDDAAPTPLADGRAVLRTSALPDRRAARLVAARRPPAPIRIDGTVFDGEGEPVPDALIEIWQANRAGRYAHPEDARDDGPARAGLPRLRPRAGRTPTGGYAFVTVKPGPVPYPDGGRRRRTSTCRCSRAACSTRLVTRIYFPDEEDAQRGRPGALPVAPERRATLVGAGRGRRLPLRHPHPGRR